MPSIEQLLVLPLVTVIGLFLGRSGLGSLALAPALFSPQPGHAWPWVMAYLAAVSVGNPDVTQEGYASKLDSLMALLIALFVSVLLAFQPIGLLSVVILIVAFVQGLQLEIILAVVAVAVLKTCGMADGILIPTIVAGLILASALPLSPQKEIFPTSDEFGYYGALGFLAALAPATLPGTINRFHQAVLKTDKHLDLSDYERILEFACGVSIILLGRPIGRTLLGTVLSTSVEGLQIPVALAFVAITICCLTGIDAFVPAMPGFSPLNLLALFAIPHFAIVPALAIAALVTLYKPCRVWLLMSTVALSSIGIISPF